MLPLLMGVGSCRCGMQTQSAVATAAEGSSRFLNKPGDPAV